MKNSKNSLVGFRLEPDLLAELVRRASLHGISHHQLARAYVVEKIYCGENAEKGTEALLAAVEVVNERLHQFQADFAFSVQALLTCAGKLKDEEAKKWVDDALTLD